MCWKMNSNQRHTMFIPLLKWIAIQQSMFKSKQLICVSVINGLIVCVYTKFYNQYLFFYLKWICFWPEISPESKIRAKMERALLEGIVTLLVHRELSKNFGSERMMAASQAALVRPATMVGSAVTSGQVACSTIARSGPLDQETYLLKNIKKIMSIKSYESCRPYLQTTHI